MLTIIQSNRLEGLADILAERLSQPLSENPLASEKVIVQSPGMSQWLKLVIAGRNGICGNVDFPLPSSFIWKLYQACIEDLPEKSAFNKPDMAWKIHELLPQFLAHEEFSLLANYLQTSSSAAPTSTSDSTSLHKEDTYFRRFQLAEKIADVYDQYLVYRPEWIMQWERQQATSSDCAAARYFASDAIPDIEMQDHRWQPMLWRAVVAYSDELQQQPYHRANMHQQLIDGIAALAGQSDAAQRMRELLPSRLFIFGISALPLQQLQVFEALSAHIPVFIFQFNPCVHYWGDIVDEKRLAKIRVRLSEDKQRAIQTLPQDDYHQVGNPLLASLGKLGRDYFDMLLDTQAMFLDAFVDEESTASNLLQRIQQDIYSLSFRGQIDALSAQQREQDAGIQAIAADDNSLVISSCHSPLRECEVLQDHLLALFETHADLSPRDVLVMMPDVGQYSPAIEAVFNSQQEGMRIPFAISDRGISQENPLISSFLQLLQLPESRFTSTEIFTLLEVPAIHQQMGVAESELPKLLHWVKEAGIRWGLDAAHKAEYQLPAEMLNTWAFGIQRLLLGYAVNSNALTEHGVPYAQVEGQDTELLGRLLQFIQRLIHYRQRILPDQRLAEKIVVARELLGSFYAENDDSQQGLQAVRDALSALEAHVKNGNSQAEISHKVFFHCVQQELSEKGVGQRFLAGAVNFCTLMPMRSIPFKVICLLGMNERDYPRQVTPIGFDLVTQTTPKRGDRSRRLDDRYLFLEALLSARQQLYISFVGRSLQDNQPKLPSIVVSELMEYCNQGFRFSTGEFTVQEHALQPFNPHYFSDNNASYSHWFSFQKHWLHFLQASVSPIDRQAVQQPPPVFGEPMQFPAERWQVSLDELIAFVQHPIRFYFQHTLSVRLEDRLEEDSDDEAFQLDGLDRYQLQQQLIKEQLNNGPSAEQRFAISRESGELPYQFVGEQQFQQLAQQSEHFVQRLAEVWSTPLDPVLIEQQLTLPQLSLFGHQFEAGHQVQLTGWLYHCQHHHQLFYRPAKIKATQWLHAWIQHLVLCAQARGVATEHLPTTTLIVGKESRVTFPPLTVAEAESLLSVWLAAFIASKQRILHVLPETAMAWVRKASEAEMLKVFQSNSFSAIAGEGEDIYVKQVIAEFAMLPTEFTACAEQLLGPMWNHAEESTQ